MLFLGKLYFMLVKNVLCDFFRKNFIFPYKNSVRYVTKDLKERPEYNL